MLNRCFIYFLPLIIDLTRLTKFKYRALTIGEVALCERIFGQSIRYDRVFITNQAYLPWQGQSVFMAPNGMIYAQDKIFKADYSKENTNYRAVFIHEMTHIFQHQHNINVLWQGAILQIAYYLSFKRYNPYHYKFVKNKAFTDYNIEQQGDIARDIFLGHLENIILKHINNFK